MTFPLDIGSIVGYSGRKKDSEVGKLRENLEHVCLVYCWVYLHCQNCHQNAVPEVTRCAFVPRVNTLGKVGL